MAEAVGCNPADGVVMVAIKRIEHSPFQLYHAMQLRKRGFVLEKTCVFQDADGLDLHYWHGLGYLPNGALGEYVGILPPGKAFEYPSIGYVVAAPELPGNGAGYALMQ